MRAGGCASGGALDFYDALQSGSAIKSLPFSTAYAVAVDDQQDIYVSWGGGSHAASVVELIPNKKRFTYTHGIYWDPLNVAPFAGNDPPFATTEYGSKMVIVPTTEIAVGNRILRWQYLHRSGRRRRRRQRILGWFGNHKNYEVDLITPNQKITNLGLQLDHRADALLIDEQGNLLVSEYHKGDALFAPGEMTPTRWFDDTGVGKPDSIAFGGNGDRLYVLDGPTIRVYDYPSGRGVLWQDSVNHGLECCQAQIAINPRPPLFDPTSYRATRPAFRYWTDGLKRR
jgi:hypothetical protein